MDVYPLTGFYQTLTHLSNVTWYFYKVIESMRILIHT